MRSTFLLVLLYTVVFWTPAAAQKSIDFNVSRIFLEIIEQSHAVKPKPDQATALLQLENQPFSLSPTPNMSDPDQQYRYFNALGYYAALGEQHPEWAVEWLGALPKLTTLGKQGLVTAINNIGPPPENRALSILIEKIPALNEKLKRLPRNLLNFPAMTNDILVALNGAFYATGKPQYTALMIKGLVETFPNGRRPNAVLTHLIPYFLQMQSLMSPKAQHTLENTATLPQMAEILPLLRGIADKSLIQQGADLDPLSTTENLDFFFKKMSEIVAQIALKNIGGKPKSASE